MFAGLAPGVILGKYFEATGRELQNLAASSELFNNCDDLLKLGPGKYQELCSSLNKMIAIPGFVVTVSKKLLFELY